MSQLFSDSKMLVRMVRGNSRISHMLLLIVSRQWHPHWHALDCQDSQLTHANVKESLEVDGKVARADLKGPVEGITGDDDWSQLCHTYACSTVFAYGFAWYI